MIAGGTPYNDAITRKTIKRELTLYDPGGVPTCVLKNVAKKGIHLKNILCIQPSPC